MRVLAGLISSGLELIDQGSSMGSALKFVEQTTDLYQSAWSW